MKSRLRTVLFLLFLLFGSALALAGRWLPDEAHYLAATQGRDCAAIRGVAKKAQLRKRDLLKWKESVVLELKEKRVALDLCATQRGALGKRKEDEQFLAEVCPEKYESWLSPSFRYLSLKQDIHDAQAAYEEARMIAQHRCRLSQSF